MTVPSVGLSSVKQIVQNHRIFSPLYLLNEKIQKIMFFQHFSLFQIANKMYIFGVPVWGPFSRYLKWQDPKNVKNDHFSWFYPIFLDHFCPKWTFSTLLGCCHLRIFENTLKTGTPKRTSCSQSEKVKNVEKTWFFISSLFD